MGRVAMSTGSFGSWISLCATDGFSAGVDMCPLTTGMSVSGGITVSTLPLSIPLNGQAVGIGSGSNSAGYINFATTRGFVGYDVSGYTVVQGGNTNGVRFLVNNATFASGTNALEIESTGLIGVGTVSPDRPVTFAQTTGEKLSLYSVTSAAGNFYGWGVTGGQLNNFVPSSAAHVFYVNSVEAGRFNSSGVTALAYGTATNCASNASPAACGSAPSGAVAIPTGTVSVSLVVNTTAVTANSRITLTADDSLTIASTTCNSTLATLVGGMAVTARTPGTSFTITYNGTIATNPLCVSYSLLN